MRAVPMPRRPLREHPEATPRLWGRVVRFECTPYPEVWAPCGSLREHTKFGTLYGRSWSDETHARALLPWRTATTPKSMCRNTPFCTCPTSPYPIGPCPFMHAPGLGQRQSRKLPALLHVVATILHAPTGRGPRRRCRTRRSSQPSRQSPTRTIDIPPCKRSS